VVQKGRRIRHQQNLRVRRIALVVLTLFIALAAVRCRGWREQPTSISRRSPASDIGQRQGSRFPSPDTGRQRRRPCGFSSCAMSWVSLSVAAFENKRRVPG
jgi:hypothetical protein